MIKTKISILAITVGMFSLAAQPKSFDFQNPPEGETDIAKQFDAIIKVESGTKNLRNQIIESDENGKNGVFVQGNNSVVNANGVKVYTKQNNSRGFYAAFGGTINAKKVEVNTEGEHCAAFATDMGEGTVSLDFGKAYTNGRGSPIIYSTGDISVKNLKGQASNSEIAVIEGKNSVLIEKSNLSGGSGLDEEVSSAVMLYQSMSGDANTGTASFTAKNSTLTNLATGDKSAFFYVTNTKAVVNLNSTKLLGNCGTLILVGGNDSKRGWGEKGFNGGELEFNAINEKLSGDVIVDEISSLTLNLASKSIFEGRVNSKKQGKVDISISKNSKLILTGDSYFNKFSDEDDFFRNIKSNGYVIYYNKNENPHLKNRTILLSDGGRISPCEYDFSAFELAHLSFEKSDSEMKLPSKNDAKRQTGQKRDSKNQPPEMNLTTITGTLNVISNKAMLIDSENNATILSVMEENRDEKNNSFRPNNSFEMNGMPSDNMSSGKMGNHPEMGNSREKPPKMNESQKNQLQKPVTFDDLKKMSGKTVSVQGILEPDGSFKVFTIEEKK